MSFNFLKNFKNPWEATGEKVRNSGVLRNVVDEWAEKNQAKILGQAVEVTEQGIFFNYLGEMLYTTNGSLKGQIYLIENSGFHVLKSSNSLSFKNLKDFSKTFDENWRQLTAESISKIFTTSVKDALLNNNQKLNVENLYNSCISIDFNGKRYNEPWDYKADNQTEPNASTTVVDGKIKVSAFQNMIGEYEATVENIRCTLAIHEFYGHGIKLWNNDYENHWKCYAAEVDSVYFQETTDSLKKTVLKKLWEYYCMAGNTANSFPTKYNLLYHKYVD